MALRQLRARSALPPPCRRLSLLPRGVAGRSADQSEEFGAPRAPISCAGAGTPIGIARPAAGRDTFAGHLIKPRSLAMSKNSSLPTRRSVLATSAAAAAGAASLFPTHLAAADGASQQPNHG